MANKKPEAVIRDSDIKATLWANNSKNGVFISTTFAKTYDDAGTPRDTNSFSGTDLLRVSELAREAYRVSNRLRREMNAAAAETDDDEMDAEEPAPQSARNPVKTKTMEQRL